MKVFQKRLKRRFFHSFFNGFAFAAGIFSFALLAVTVGTVNTFTSGQVIRANDINTNFASLKTAIESIPDWTKNGANAQYSSGGVIVNTTAMANSATVTVNGRISSSVLGVYCGVTTFLTGNMGGYTGAKALCVAACGNPNAHMCTGHEMVISRQLGITIQTDIWYSAGISSPASPSNQSDCLGWTDSSASHQGGFYNITPYLTYNTCNNNRPAACCL